MLVGVACARDSRAQAAGGAARAAADDTSAVSRLLRVVRGVDPVLCELATRTVDMHGSWSRWGPLSDDPLHTDSAAAALIEWVQNEHSDPRVVPTLRAGMRDPDACVRRVSGSFLGRVSHPSAIDALLSVLEDGSAGTREVAALGLGMSERQVGVDALQRRLRDESAGVRRAAAWALGSMEARDALTTLIEVLARDPDARVRQTAAWAIGRIES
jgi:HEAT repeat protein